MKETELQRMPEELAKIADTASSDHDITESEPQQLTAEEFQKIFQGLNMNPMAHKHSIRRKLQAKKAIRVKQNNRRKNKMAKASRKRNR